jgi:hypothetical protein
MDDGRRLSFEVRITPLALSVLDHWCIKKMTSGRRANGEALAPERAFCSPESRLPFFAILLTSTLLRVHHYPVNMAEPNTRSLHESKYRETVALFDDPERCIKMAKFNLT